MRDSDVDQIYFKLCSDHLSVEAIPKIRMTIDLAKMKVKPPSDCEIVMWTPHFAILRTQSGSEITLRRDGRMIVRKSKSEDAAREAASRVIEVVRREYSP